MTCLVLQSGTWMLHYIRRTIYSLDGLCALETRVRYEHGQTPSSTDIYSIHECDEVMTCECNAK